MNTKINIHRVTTIKTSVGNDADFKIKWITIACKSLDDDNSISSIDIFIDPKSPLFDKAERLVEAINAVLNEGDEK